MEYDTEGSMIEMFFICRVKCSFCADVFFSNRRCFLSVRVKERLVSCSAVPDVIPFYSLRHLPFFVVLEFTTQ